MLTKTFRLLAGLHSSVNGSKYDATSSHDDTILLAIGAMLSKQQLLFKSTNINDYEFKIFSQWGDDGIIQYLVNNVAIQNNTFIEFGVGNYAESNTRFLMMNNNWSGFVMDSSEEAMNSLNKRSWYWKYNLTNKAAFIDKDNINSLLAETGFSNIGILSIDIDGNDYYILNEIDLSVLNPSIIIAEYNSVFGSDRAITVPYRKDFDRTKTHYSNLFFGASLSALKHVAARKGYALVGCTLSGNNSFFVRKDLLNEKVKELPVASAYKNSMFRESRNEDHSLSFISGKNRLDVIKGLEVINVLTDQTEKL
jgi:hypothetical protein